MRVKYELKDGEILKDGHTMFKEDIVRDLNRKAYLEEDIAKIKDEILNTVDDSLRNMKAQTELVDIGFSTEEGSNYKPEGLVNLIKK